MGGGEGPGHEATPVVTDEDEFFAGGEMNSKRANVLDQNVEAILSDLRGLVGEIEPAHVQRDGMVIAAERGQLILPGIPKLREAVQKQDERACSGGDIVQANAVHLCVVVRSH